LLNKIAYRLLLLHYALAADVRQSLASRPQLSLKFSPDAMVSHLSRGLRLHKPSLRLKKYVILSDLYAMSAVLQMMADGNRELQSL
jgi:hypothetical protein